MSTEYDRYIEHHKDAVVAAFDWIRGNMWDSVETILPKIGISTAMAVIDEHDDSKWRPSEYDAYDAFFYGVQTEEVKQSFDHAWLHHIHHNPHHWQHWLLHEDEGGVKALEMPDVYILEMLCDWWSFSWRNYIEVREASEPDIYPIEYLYGIFDWYSNHYDTMVLADKTRTKVDQMLDAIHHALDICKAKEAELDDTDEFE